MGLDLDYVFAKSAIDELEKLLSDQPHGDREKIADDIILLVDVLKAKYSKKEKKNIKVKVGIPIGKAIPMIPTDGMDGKIK